MNKQTKTDASKKSAAAGRRKRKYLTKDLPAPTPEQIERAGELAKQQLRRATDSFKELGFTLEEQKALFKKEWDRQEKETQRKLPKLLKQGYPPRLARKIALGFHPNEDIAVK